MNCNQESPQEPLSVCRAVLQEPCNYIALKFVELELTIKWCFQGISYCLVQLKRGCIIEELFSSNVFNTYMTAKGEESVITMAHNVPPVIESVL